MEQDAIRPPPGLEALDHHARLRIDHRHGIAVQVGRVDQAAIRRKRHVADEIVRRALGPAATTGNVRAGVSLPSAKVNSNTAAASRRPRTRGRRSGGKPCPARHRAPACWHHTRPKPIDARVTRGRPVSAVEHQQILAIGRERRGHGQRVERHLLAHRAQPPAAVQQKSAVRKRPHLLARRRLRAQQRRQHNHAGRQGYPPENTP